MIEHYKDPKNFNIEPKRNKFVAETTKVSEITDLFGRTRYKVILTDFDPTQVDPDISDMSYDDLRRRDLSFLVEVWCFVIDKDPILVYRSEIVEYLSEATKLFYDKVDAYTSFVKAETKEILNIWIYSDKIHYHIVDPKCCAKCKYAKPVPNNRELYSRDKINKFICTNPIIHKVDNDYSIDNMSQFDAGHTLYESREHYIVILPEVDGNGICDFYTDKKQ